MSFEGNDGSLAYSANPQVVNSSYDHESDSRDVRDATNNRSKRVKMYETPSVPASRTLRRGEISYAMRIGHERFDSENRPFVRTGLNGSCFKRKDARLTPKDVSSSIRMVGVNAYDVPYDASKPMQCVALTSGTITTRNNGDKHIDAGHAIQAYIDPNAKGDHVTIGRRPLTFELNVTKTDFFKDDETAKSLMHTMNAALNDTEVDEAAARQLLDRHAAAIQKMYIQLTTRAANRCRNVVGVAVSPAEPGQGYDELQCSALNPLSYAKITHTQ